jgi:hypothetical protein
MPPLQTSIKIREHGGVKKSFSHRSNLLTGRLGHNDLASDIGWPHSPNASTLQQPVLHGRTDLQASSSGQPQAHKHRCLAIRALPSAVSFNDRRGNPQALRKPVPRKSRWSEKGGIRGSAPEILYLRSMGRFVGLRMRNGLAVSIGRGVFIAAHEFLERRYAWRMPKSENPPSTYWSPVGGKKQQRAGTPNTGSRQTGASGKAKQTSSFPCRFAGWTCLDANVNRTKQLVIIKSKACHFLAGPFSIWVNTMPITRPNFRNTRGAARTARTCTRCENEKTMSIRSNGIRRCRER